MKTKYIWWLLWAGVAMAVIDKLTTPADGTGGKLFGAGGILEPINSKIPVVHIGETALNLGEWLAIGSGAALAYKRFR